MNKIEVEGKNKQLKDGEKKITINKKSIIKYKC
jgi:hypothetical protein